MLHGLTGSFVVLGVVHSVELHAHTSCHCAQLAASKLPERGVYCIVCGYVLC